MRRLGTRMYQIIPAAGMLLLLAACELVGGGPNAGPTADAGSDQEAILGAGVQLDGSASSDPDGDTLTPSWQFVSVPAASALTTAAILGADTLAAQFTPDAAGEYIVSLSVTDPGGLEDQDDVTVSVTAGLDLLSDDDTGISDSDNITSQASSLRLAGFAEGGASVELFRDDAVLLQSLTAEADGSWIADVDLSGLVGPGVVRVVEVYAESQGASTVVTTEPLTLTIDRESPDPVTGLTADPGVESVGLSWTSPLATDLTSIATTFGPGNGAPQPVGADPGAGSVLIDGLNDSTAYTFNVMAIDIAGNVSSAEMIGATTLSRFAAAAEITVAADQPQSLFATDLDGDGDPDLLSASSNDDRVAWYENTDGLGTFSSGTDITTGADGVMSVFATDLDGDGDADVLSASWLDFRVTWYENTDGEGSFTAGTDLATRAAAAWSVFATDLDGDDDADVLSAWIDGRVIWYENTDGEGTFSAGTEITTLADGARSVYAVDLDGDGDADVLSASEADDSVTWYENTDGLGTFSAGTDITTGADGARSVVAADLDGDGDADVLSASFTDDRVVWYENTDGEGTFSTGTDITSSADGVRVVFATDLDGDGDVDVLSASMTDDRVVWYRNTDGEGTFSAGTEIDVVAGARAVFAADLDADGDADVVAGARDLTSEISWYENLTD